MAAQSLKQWNGNEKYLKYSGQVGPDIFLELRRLVRLHNDAAGVKRKGRPVAKPFFGGCLISLGGTLLTISIMAILGLLVDDPIPVFIILGIMTISFVTAYFLILKSIINNFDEKERKIRHDIETIAKNICRKHPIILETVGQCERLMDRKVVVDLEETLLNVQKISTDTTYHSNLPTSSDESSGSAVSNKYDNTPREFLENPPWHNFPKGVTAIGKAVEKYLAIEIKQPVKILAFEIVGLKNSGLSKPVVILLLPLIFLLIILLIVPGWIYLTYRTIVEWNEARQNGIHPTTMVGYLLLAYFIPIAAGVVMLPIVLKKWSAKILILARTQDSYVLLYKNLTPIWIHRFDKVQIFPLSSNILQVIKDESGKTILSLRTAQEEFVLVVGRHPQVRKLFGQAVNENFKILIDDRSPTLSDTNIAPSHRIKNTVSESTSSTPTIESRKSFMIALLLSFFFGFFGFDRFYLGYYGLGILKFITCGGFLIWWLLDVILISFGKIPDAKGRHLMKF